MYSQQSSNLVQKLQTMGVKEVVKLKRKNQLMLVLNLTDDVAGMLGMNQLACVCMC